MPIGKQIVKGGLRLAEEASKAPRMSEALNPHVGKRLYITQADRTALNYPEGLLGGPGYTELAGIDPKYKDIAWAVQSPGVAKTMVQSMARNPEEAVWANLIGSPEQHRSNKVVFDRLMNQFEKAVQEDKLTPELRERINTRLANIRDPKTGKAFFPEDVDILSPEFQQHAQTFHQRAFIADILAGKGVGGQKGKIIPYEEIIKETTDPLLLEAKTGDIGDRLFSLSGKYEERPELHPAFHYSLSGKKESEAFKPAPQGIVLKDFVDEFTKRTGRLPTYYDLTRGYAPNVKVTDEMLERMYKEGYAGGGKVAKGIVKALEDIKLPPAENSARTQIVGTTPTYEKARDILRKEGIEGSDIIDFGAGKGLGSTMMKAHSFEPYPQGWYPTYTKSEDIPTDAYRGLLNLNVLNVLDPEMRAHTVKEIGRVMQPEGGTGLITTRGRDVLNTIGGREGPEPMSIITSRDTYQKGFTPDELRAYIKHILGSDFEYEPLNLGPAGVKIKKKAKGGTVEDDTREIAQDPTAYLVNEVNPVETSIPSASEFKKRIGKPVPFLTDIIGGAYKESKEYKPRALTDIPINAVSEIAGMPIDIASELQTDKVVPIRSDVVLPREITRLPTKTLPLSSEALKKATTDIGLTSGEDYPYAQGAVSLLGAPEAKTIAKGVGTVAKEGVKGAGRLMGEAIERNIHLIEPRMGIIKEQGGMLVGGERDLDEALLHMKKNEGIDAPQIAGSTNFEDKNPNAVALNNWIDTKVRKYIRNQAGTEADPIRKLIDEGVPYNFSLRSGESKFATARARKRVGKPAEGISQTPEGKEWEYTVDTAFHPTSSDEVKAILNDPNIDDARKKSKLRMEHDLPIQTDADYETIKLINQIPDKHVYDLNTIGLTQKLGLNHISDVLYEDLMSGKLKPEQLNQMSIEKAVRYAAEYDAKKAREMEKAHATSIEGMPIPKQYDDGYKWVELKHKDVARTKEALKSEGEMMGHCVGSYCSPVMSGEIKIYSLRSPDGKSHVTIEARPQYSASEWYRANADLINSDPYLKEIEPNIASGDIDAKYGNNPSTDADYVRMMEKEMRKKGIEPIEPQGVLSLHQVKGKQNKRPDEKYQKYVSDFIKNNPTKHEIDDVKELDNTNLMSTQDIYDTGLVSKELHFHPDVEKALIKKYPPYKNLMSRDKLDMTYDLFKEVAEDFGKQNIFFVDKDDILNHIREKYLPPKKKSGGPINLNQEYKLENMRRRYG